MVKKSGYFVKKNARPVPRSYMAQNKASRLFILFRILKQSGRGSRPSSHIWRYLLVFIRFSRFLKFVIPFREAPRSAMGGNLIPHQTKAHV
jgi:hypothetical protein